MKHLIISALLAVLPGAGGVALAAESHDHAAAPVSDNKTILATGTVKNVDAAAGKLVIDHEPIPALKWPRMVMDFRLADKAMAGKVKVGDKVKFTLMPGEKGSYIVTAIEPVF